jgi:DNA-binding transcriptional LysR family regulator
MTKVAGLDKIELQLVRVFHTVISERSVSRAALKLQSTQPAVSAKLARLRRLVGDPLLVRSGGGMAPTATALSLMPAATQILQGAQKLFGGGPRVQRFVPGEANLRLRLAASDFMDPLFLPELLARVRREAPGIEVDVVPLSAELDYRRALAHGDLDLVVGNWMQPPAELHISRLLADEVVCLVSRDHPATRLGRAWTIDRYLACDHLVPMPFHAGGRGFVDEHLAQLGHERHTAVRLPHFALAPALVARSSLVLTTGRLFCERFEGREDVRILRCPVPMPLITYYQLWHDLAHTNPAVKWLREAARDVAHSLARGRTRHVH